MNFNYEYAAGEFPYLGVTVATGFLVLVLERSDFDDEFVRCMVISQGSDTGTPNPGELVHWRESEFTKYLGEIILHN